MNELSLSDLIALAIANAIEGQRESLDAMKGVSQVTVICSFDERRGMPRKVSIRPELVSNSHDEGGSK